MLLVDVVDALRADPSSTALLIDFDGTLAPIVPSAGDARPLPGAVEVLAELCQVYGVVALVSGRPVDFLLEHVGAGPTLVGLYGLERAVAGRVVPLPEGERWRGVIDEVVVAARRELPPGVDVEHKGLSVTLHVRPVPEAAAAVRDFAEAAAARTGLERRMAKMSEELHPPVAVDKGTVVRELAAPMQTVAYVGDDVGDRPAFEALDELALAGRRTAKVVVASAELDPWLREAADLLLPDPAAVLSLLQALR